jgi:O-methyltransferase
MNRQLRIIYGAGNKGRMLLRLLENGEPDSGVHCFIDNDQGKWGIMIGNYPVRQPDYLLTLPRESFRVLVAVGPGYHEVRDKLVGYGLSEHLDFVDACIIPASLADMDEKYRLVRERIRDYTLLSDERLQVLHQFARATANLPGDAAEVGVYRGGTAYLLATIFAIKNKRLRLFDTFNGIPDLVDSIDLHRQGDFSDVSISTVAQYLREFDNIVFHPGVFPDSLTPEADAVRYSYIHVDADIYRSVFDSCTFFYPRLVQGGMMLFDDYGFVTCPGVRKAVDEFFADKLHKPVYLPTGQALVINN